MGPISRCGRPIARSPTSTRRSRRCRRATPRGSRPGTTARRLLRSAPLIHHPTIRRPPDMAIDVEELRSLAAGARKAAEHYREHPDEITRGAIVDVYTLIARLAEQLARPA